MTAPTRLHRVILTTSSLRPVAAFYEKGLQLRSAEPPPACKVPEASFLGPEEPFLTVVSRPWLDSPSPDLKPLCGIVFGVGRGTMGHWARNLSAMGARLTGRAWAFDDEYLCLSDPDGAELALVETDQDDVHLAGVELHVRRNSDEVILMAQHLGFVTVGLEGLTTRLQMGRGGVFLDLLNRPLGDASRTSRSDHQGNPHGAIVPILQRPHHEIVFRVPDGTHLGPIADYAKQIGFTTTQFDELSPYILIDMGEQCDFDFRVCVDFPEAGGG